MIRLNTIIKTQSHTHYINIQPLEGNQDLPAPGHSIFSRLCLCVIEARRDRMVLMLSTLRRSLNRSVVIHNGMIIKKYQNYIIE